MLCNLDEFVDCIELFYVLGLYYICVFYEMEF